MNQGTKSEGSSYLDRTKYQREKNKLVEKKFDREEAMSDEEEARLRELHRLARKEFEDNRDWATKEKARIEEAITP